MKKTLISTTCAVILVLVSFSSVASARVAVDERIDVIQKLGDRINDMDGKQGGIWNRIIEFILILIVLIGFPLFGVIALIIDTL